MESFLKLYFGNAIARSRVIMTIIYLIAMMLVVNGILGWFNIHYSFPKEITFASCLNFIMSAQILYPISGVALFYTVHELFSAIITGYLYQRFKFFLFRKISDDQMIDNVPHELFLKKFITWSFNEKFERGTIQKGSSFHLFEPFMKTMFWEDFNLVSSWKLSTESFFTLMLALAFHLNANPIIKIAFIIAFIGWLLFLIVYWSLVRQSEYRELYEQVYFNVMNPGQAKEIYKVSTYNKYFKHYQAWEMKRNMKKRLKTGEK